ncbi:MAG TPA: methylmalonyl-CoA mutase family protein, partial [Acidimicrobiales bacterium]|nr:methylmalonyl-CoA mutase family protein [Acidimicrobiales bacterium]
PEVEQAQRKRLAEVRRARSDETLAEALSALARAASEPTANLMPPILDAVRAYATVGEVMDTLAGVFGRWVEDVRL